MKITVQLNRDKNFESVTIDFKYPRRISECWIQIQIWNPSHTWYTHARMQI